jgi:hypothetical protein
VIHTSTYRSLTPDEIAQPEEIKSREDFDTKRIAQKLGKSTQPEDIEPDVVETPVFERYEDDHDGEVKQAPDQDDEEEVTPEETDDYLGAGVLLPLGDKMVTGRVCGKRDREGSLHGLRNANPILEVEFPNSEAAEYAANIIAENMYAQCDAEGNQYLLMDSLVDYKSDGHAIKVADMFVIRNGRQHMRKTTIGWKFCVQWKDGTTTWERLAGLKESYPVEVAEYAVAQGIDHEPAFVWWVPFTLKKRNRSTPPTFTRLRGLNCSVTPSISIHSAATALLMPSTFQLHLHRPMLIESPVP